MGIFDFLKKILGDKETKEIGKEKLAFSEIGNWTENKRKEIENKEKKIFALIQGNINILVSELKKKILILKNVDIESKKAEDKLKSLTEEGRKKYLEFVESLLKDLDSLQEDGLEKTINSIDKFFSKFNKSSHMSYERATILIGKEIGDIKERLKTFSKELIKIFDKNKDIINISKAISVINFKSMQFEKIESEINETNKLIISLDKDIDDKKEENKKILEETEKSKKSPEYLKHLESLNKINFLGKDLEKEINNLRQLINFKALASFYHIFENEMAVLKAHKDNFQANFQKDKGRSILDLLDQAKLNTNEISDKINQIRDKKEEIIRKETEIRENKNPTRELASELAKIVFEIDNLNNKKAKKQKNLEKLGANKEDIIHDIKEKFEKIGVEVV